MPASWTDIFFAAIRLATIGLAIVGLSVVVDWFTATDEAWADWMTALVVALPLAFIWAKKE